MTVESKNELIKEFIAHKEKENKVIKIKEYHNDFNKLNADVEEASVVAIMILALIYDDLIKLRKICTNLYSPVTKNIKVTKAYEAVDVCQTIIKKHHLEEFSNIFRSKKIGKSAND
jgi:hypothetical protein